MTTNCYVGSFTYDHNNPPSPFNPQYDPRAQDWSILATLDTINAGLYDDETIARETIAAYRLAAYHKRKAQGTPDPIEVQHAKQVIYDRG